MLRIKVHFPIFVFALLLYIGFGSCNKIIKDADPKRPYDSVVDLAELSLKKQDYEQAYKYFTVSKSLCTEEELERKIYTLGNLAEIYRINGDYLESEATATEAFQYFKTCKSPDYKVYIYNCLGINFQEKEDFKNALLYYDKAYQTAKSEADKLIIQNNIAVVYLEKQDYKSAIAKLLPLLNNHTLFKSPVNHAKVLDNLGFAYFNLKAPVSFAYLNQALTIRDSLKNDFESIPSYIHFSKFYEATNPSLSLEYANKALEAATRVNNSEDKLEALDLLIKNSDGLDLKKYYAAYSGLNKLTIKNKQKARNAFAKIKYDATEAIQNEQRYKNKMQLAILMAVLLVIIGAYIVYSIRKRNKKKLQASVYETENRISKKIHDELANDVFQTIAFAETQDLQNPEKRETLMDSLDSIYTKARDISQTNSEIQTEERFGNFLSDLLNSFNNDEVNVIIKNGNAIDWDKINKESKIAVYRVIQELMVNMKKHSGADLVIVSFEGKLKSIEIKYSDNGKGFGNRQIFKKGLQNAENRIHAVKGTFTFDKETIKGLRVTIQIPK